MRALLLLLAAAARATGDGEGEGEVLPDGSAETATADLDPQPWSSWTRGARRPAVLEGTPADAWPAMGLWTPAWFAESGVLLDGLHASNSSAFAYHDAAKTLPEWRANALRGPPPPPPVPRHRDLPPLPAAEGVARMLASADTGEHLYYDARLTDAALAPMIEPRGDMLPGARATLWLSGPEVGYNAHYDTADTLLVQLEGAKEVWLWPPEESAHLHLSSQFSPRHRQAQLDPAAGHVDAARFPLRAQLAPPLRVLLRPGQALYMPVFWPHKVACASAAGCVSVSLFAPAGDDFVDAMYGVAVPFDGRWGPEQRQWALAEALPRLAAAVPGGLRAVFDGRYAPTFAPLARRQFCVGPAAPLGLDLRVAEQQVARLAAADGAFTLLFADWVEDMVKWAADGREEEVPGMLYDCCLRG